MARKGRKHRERRRTQVTCVYCGEVGVCTEEHVIPECFFPDGHRPLKAEFVIVPVCRPCNNRKAKDDAYVRDLLAADIACDGNPIVRAMQPTVFRSARKNWSDFARTAKAHGGVGAMHSPGGIYLGHFPSVPVDWKRVGRFFGLVTRGLYWKKFEKRLPDNYEFDVRRHYSSEFLGLYEYVMEHGGNGPHTIGDDVFGCAFMMAQEDAFITYWLMWIYDAVVISVMTGPAEFIQQRKQPQEESKPVGIW